MAREHPRYEHSEWPEWEFREFPLMVYPGAADPKKPYDARGKVLPGVIVNSQEEADQVLGIDRSAPAISEDEPDFVPASQRPAPARKTVPTSTKGVSRLETADDQRAELIAEAERIGIAQFDKSWSLARMQDTIDTFKAGAEKPEVV